MIWWPYVLAGCSLSAAIGFFTAALMVMSKRSDEPDQFEHDWGRRP